MLTPCRSASPSQRPGPCNPCSRFSSGAEWLSDLFVAAPGWQGNLYAVKFAPDGKTGFVLGNDGVLLRYIGK